MDHPTGGRAAADIVTAVADRVDDDVEAALAEAKRVMRQVVGTDRAVVRIAAGIAALIIAIGGVIVLRAVVQDHVREESLQPVAIAVGARSPTDLS